MALLNHIETRFELLSLEQTKQIKPEWDNLQLGGYLLVLLSNSRNDNTKALVTSSLDKSLDVFLLLLTYVLLVVLLLDGL